MRVTDEPPVKVDEQVEPQLMPEGNEVTVPLPVPLLLTLKVYGPAKVAVTVLSESIVTVQEPVPEHPPPDQPVKVEPDAGVAARIAVAPLVTFAVQVEPQLMPAGEEVTVPLPVPLLLTLKLCVAAGMNTTGLETVLSP